METKQLSALQQPTTAAPATPVSAPAPAAAPRGKAPPVSPFAGDSMSYSNAEAMRVLMRAGQTGRDLAAKMRTAANKDEIGAKQQGVRDQAAQVKGEQHSAIQGLASKLLGAGVSAGAGYKGTKMRGEPDGTRRSLGAGLDSAAQGGALGNVVTSASDMQDKLSGGAHAADQAKIALKQDDVQVSLAAQRKDSAAAGVTQADKVIDGALDAMRDFRTRAAEVISKLTGG